MALRIARGLFRLWLVLTVLWMGAVGTMAWWHDSPHDWVVVSECPASPEGYVVHDPNPPPEGYVIDKPRCVTPVSLLSEVFVVNRNSAAMALIPPVFVLTVGAAFVWAFRGFRT